MPPKVKTSGPQARHDRCKKELIGKFNIVSYIQQSRQFINLDHGKGKGLPEVVAA